MIDITGKSPTLRTATARGRVLLAAPARQALLDGTLPKGDAIEIARIAGVMAAKQCADLIPYCHQIPLKHVEVTVLPIEHGVEVTSTARAEASTGVEMEALTAVSVAALTIFDMCKALDPAATITDICVLRKVGGKSGEWERAGEDD